MPEGQVSHYNALTLGEALSGQPLTEIVVGHPRLGPQRLPERLADDRLSRFAAAGKHHLIHFASGRVLHSHLRMSGSWRLQAPATPIPRGGLFLALTTTAGSACLYRCPQVRLLEPEEPLPGPVRALGPDLLAADVDPADAAARAIAEASPEREIGEVLLDQRGVAGIGNAYKNEVLFLTGISPWRLVGAVSDEEAREIGSLAANLLSDGVREGGMIRTYAPGGSGVPGAKAHWVHHRPSRACRRCGTAIRSRGQGDDNRTSFWCPRCQT